MAGNFFINALNTGSHSILRHQAEIRATNYLYRSFYVSNNNSCNLLTNQIGCLYVVLTFDPGSMFQPFQKMEQRKHSPPT